VVNLGAGEGVLNLASIAASDVEESEWQMDGLERVVKHRPDFWNCSSAASSAIPPGVAR